MLRLLGLLLFSLLLSLAQAQQRPLEIPLNSSTVFKDAKGQIISFETFLEYTSGTGYEMNPVFDEQNNLKEVIVVKAAIAAPRANIDPSQFANTVELIDRIPPDFAGVDLQGNYYDAENLQGKVVVLKFWFKACQPCIEEIPELNELVQAYRDHPDVVFLAPSLDQKSMIETLLKQQPFDYAIIPDARKIARAYQVPGYPTHVVLDKEGFVKVVYLGVNHNIGQKLNNAITHALQQEKAIASIPTPPPAAEEEIFLSPQSIIKNEAGERVPFDRFVDLMARQEFQLLAQKDEKGQAYILMKAVKH